MSIPSKPSFLEVARMMNQMVPELSKNVKAIKPIFKAAKGSKEFANGLADVGKRSKYFISDWKFNQGQAGRAVKVATKTVETVKKEATVLQKTVKVLNTDVKDSKKLWNALLRKVGGGIQGADKMGRVMSILLPIATAIASVGISVFVNEIQGWRNDLNEKSTAQLSADVSKVLGILNQYKTRIDTANKSVEKANKDIDSLSTKYAPLRTEVRDAAKKANDSLYEVRQGRKILEGKIAEAAKRGNDALYEVRQGRKILEDRISKLSPEAIQKQVSNAVSSLRAEFQKQVDKILADIRNPQQSKQVTQADLQRVTQEVSKINNTVRNIPQAIERSFSAGQATVTAVVQRAINPIAKIGESWGVTVTPASVTPATVTVSQDGALTVTPATVTPVTVTPSQFSSSAVGKQVNATIKQEISDTDRKIDTLAGGLSAVGGAATQAVNIANQARTDANRRVLDPRVDDLYRQLREREKMDREANRKLDEILPKLDSILPTIAGIPLIAGRVIDGIKPSIPTLPQIDTTVGTAMCRNLKTGCGKQAIDDAVGNVIGNNNQNSGALLNAVNTGLNAGNLAASLSLLPTINNKLGEQIPGGISGKLERFSKWLHLDRALNMMIWATTIHNAAMLSNDIGQTLLGAISNVFQLFGLKDSEGQAFDLGSIISSSIENLIKGIIGADNYTELRQTWAKAVRVYQATTNVIMSVTNIGHSITNALEVIGGQNGKIGNALRVWGVVGEKAYGWFNPQPNYHSRILNFFESAQEGANAIQMVTQAPLDVVNAVTEFNNSTTELVKAVKEDPETPNRGVAAEEAQQTKQLQEQIKTASQGVVTTLADIFNANE